MYQDPRQRLSDQARQRISHTQGEAERIRWEAFAAIAAKRLTGADAQYEQNQADLEAARVVLTVALEEYRRAGGWTKAEIQAAMHHEIDAAAHNLELYVAQRRLLEVEFTLLLASPPLTHEERIAKMLAWCHEHQMSREEFAQDVLHVGRTTFYRWERDPSSVPRTRRLIDRIIDAL